MRRTDREVTDRAEMLRILDGCTTLRLAMINAGKPYVVPLTFGWKDEGGRLTVYFHCAKAGLKLDCLKADPSVCFEGDVFLCYQKTAHGITTRYRSVIGTGTCSEVTDPTEVTAALELILAHCGVADYPLDRCRELSNVMIIKLTADTLTAKQNLPE